MIRVIPHLLKRCLDKGKKNTVLANKLMRLTPAAAAVPVENPPLCCLNRMIAAGLKGPSERDGSGYHVWEETK